MHYEEFAPPDRLRCFVRATWRMEGGGTADERLQNAAMPDGCVELIRRTGGRSIWQGEQPETFVAGLCTRPATLEMSGDAAFVGLRLWPWAWSLIGQPSCPDFHDRWIAADPSGVAAQLLLHPGAVFDRLEKLLGHSDPDPIGKHVPHCKTTAELAERSGRSHRTIQRWFEWQVGLPPRFYFKLLRFQKAVEHGHSDQDTLAGQAATLGYSDQAHMSRDFRTFSGQTTRRVRDRARGPFVEDAD